MKNYTLRKDWPLTDEQNEVIDFMIHKNKCVNACQTGFGKTYSTLTAGCWLLLKYSELDIVALIPQKAVKAFKRELEEKLRVKYNIISSQDTRQQEGARIHLITQTMLKDNMEYITELAKNHKILLMVDEAHILEDNKSKFYNYVANIRPLAQIVWFMTATPLKNDIEGLYWLMYMLDPNIVGDWWRFRSTYCILEKHMTYRIYGKGKNKQKKRVEVSEIVGYKNLDRLHKILDEFIIIKQKPYNLKYYYHKTELNEKEQSHYLEAGKGLLRESAKDSFAVRMHDLQMVVDNINEKYRVEEKLSSKEQLFLSLVKKKMELKQPSIIYCDYNDVIDRLEKLLLISKKQTGVKQILKVTGDIPLKERTKVEEQIDNNTVVLITSAGSESVNLQRANSVIFYDIPFSIKTYIQTIGRVTRIDSKYNEQYIHHIEVSGTIDSYKRCLIQINGGLIESMFGRMETLPLEVGQVDRNVTYWLKQGLLWCFKQGRLLTEQELEQILKQSKVN